MSGGSDKGKKTERHSTRKGAGSILKLTYTSPGTNEDTSMALDGTAVVISSDEEYEDVASPTMTVDLPSTPIGVPFDSATGQGKRFIFTDEEEEEEDLYVRDVLGGSAVVAPTTVVEPTTPAVDPTTTAVIPPGVVRTTIAALQAVAAGGSAVVAPTTAVEPTTTVVEPTTTVVATQTDPMEFPFVFPVRKGEKWWL